MWDTDGKGRCMKKDGGWQKLKGEITDEIYNDISEDAGIKSTMNARTFSRTNMNKRWKMIYDLLSGYGQ